MLTTKRIINHFNHNTAQTVLSKSSLTKVHQRNYPGKYRAVEYNKSEKPCTGASKTIPYHELSHKNIQHVETGVIYGALTKSPKTGVSNYKYLSDERWDEVNDPKNPQYVGIYNNPKIVSDPNVLKQYPNLQPYLDKNEESIEKMVKKKNNASLAERTSKEDSKFYNENGTRDEDNFPNK